MTLNTQKAYTISVDHTQYASAVNALNRYFEENHPDNASIYEDPLPASSFYAFSCILVMAVLSLIHFWGIYSGSQREMILAYGASALYIFQGESFRATTALFLHSDLPHLMGNLAGLVIFAAPVIRICGFGMGWFALLLCSSTANLINAYSAGDAHLSIGASTAVLAASGMLASLQALRTGSLFSLKAIAPVCAGFVLLGLFSQGENTDVGAHLLGFLFGLTAGPALFFLRHSFTGVKTQLYFMTASLIIVAAAAFGPILT